LNDGTPAASTTATGFDVANLIDWRTYTKWKPSALPATVDVDVAGSGLAWEFTNTLDGWTASGATTTTNPTTVTLTSTGADPRFTSPATTFNGSDYRYIVARFKRTAGSGWQGAGFYVTPAHGESSSFFKDIADPTGGAPGGFVIGVWDMHDLTIGGDDWEDSIIKSIRLDLGDSASDEFEIDWIMVCKSPYADYWALWGHDMGSVNASIVDLIGSNDNFAATMTIDSVNAGSDRPIVRYFSKAGPYRYWRFNIGAGTAPTIGIAAIGEYLELPVGLTDGFDPIGREPMGPFNRSVEGQPLGRAVAYQKWKQSISAGLIDWAWLRTNWLPAWEAHLRSTPFVFDWNPADATYGNEPRLVAIESGFNGPHHPGQIADLQFTISGAI
jgi:hypothetical protein